jgi:hypothetical protein|tara:strand:+ start:103 stop:549 length:447 start_codon:yes stop_codon:yes gene_type:complete
MAKNKTSFKAGNSAAEKWTEEKALQLADELIVWLKKEDVNIFYEDFLFIEKDLYKELIAYLSNKFPKSFGLKIKRAKKIQEIKLKKLGVLDQLNATMTRFTLINNHGWSDKVDSTVEQTVKSEIDYSKLDAGTIKNIIKQLKSDKTKD